MDKSVLKKRIRDAKLFSGNVEWSSKNVWKIISANVTSKRPNNSNILQKIQQLKDPNPTAFKRSNSLHCHIYHMWTYHEKNRICLHKFVNCAVWFFLWKIYSTELKELLMWNTLRLHLKKGVYLDLILFGYSIQVDIVR